MLISLINSWTKEQYVAACSYIYYMSHTASGIIPWERNTGHRILVNPLHFPKSILECTCSFWVIVRRKTKGNISTSSPGSCYVEECKNFLSHKVKSPLGIFLSLWGTKEDGKNMFWNALLNKIFRNFKVRW